VSGRPRSPGPARGGLRTTVRRAADDTRTATEFFERLEQEGLLVRLRYSRTNPGEVTGYAVALLDSPEPLWCTGGQLADDLTLPRLRRRWADSARIGDLPEDDLTHEERQAFYDDAARAAANATSQIRRHLATDPYAAEDACWAASDALHVAGRVTGNRHLRLAADAYDRAARAPHGRIPRPTSAGTALRTTARLLALAGIQDRTTVSLVLLVGRLIALLDTIAQIRLRQQRQAQADAARRASRHLEDAQTAAGWHRASQQDAHPVPSQVRIAMAAFPTPWAPAPGAVPIAPSRVEGRPLAPRRRAP
jgi:hypothetical protein